MTIRHIHLYHDSHVAGGLVAAPFRGEGDETVPVRMDGHLVGHLERKRLGGAAERRYSFAFWPTPAGDARGLRYATGAQMNPVLFHAGRALHAQS